MLIWNQTITGHCSFISEAVEGAAAQLAGTVAFNGDNLDLADGCSVLGPGCEGDDLRERGTAREDAVMLLIQARMTPVPLLCQLNTYDGAGANKLGCKQPTYSSLNTSYWAMMF